MTANIFETDDLGLAAYLYAQAYEPIRTVIHNHETFAFPEQAALSADAYYSGASVPAKSLVHALHELIIKGRIND